jgi:hypothetical protein
MSTGQPELEVRSVMGGSDTAVNDEAQPLKSVVKWNHFSFECDLGVMFSLVRVRGNKVIDNCKPFAVSSSLDLKHVVL